MRALVTGCAGFIGSHLSERLLKEGYQVKGIDCFLNFYPRSQKERNLKGLIGSKGFQFIEGNLLNEHLDKLVEEVDYVFHQAAQPGVLDSWGENFGIYTENNVRATQHLLEACKERKIEKFIYASSSSIYGSTKELPMREETLPRPFSPYGVTKLAAEHLCTLYRENFGIPVVMLRYFTVYGPRQRPDMAIYRFLSAQAKKGPIEIYGDGRQSRDFTYIDDIIEANILTIHAQIEGGLFNIGGGSRVSLNELLEVIQKVSGERLRVVKIQAKKGDVPDTCSDNNRAERVLGYKPTVGLEEGVRREWDWLKGGR
jgi:nucleoside-diphosphate-sugar epimerase